MYGSTSAVIATEFRCTTLQIGNDLLDGATLLRRKALAKKPIDPRL